MIRSDWFVSRLSGVTWAAPSSALSFLACRMTTSLTMFADVLAGLLRSHSPACVCPQQEDRAEPPWELRNAPGTSQEDQLRPLSWSPQLHLLVVGTQLISTQLTHMFTHL